MGVKDLWKILEPAGRPISPEALEGLVLGVDVSIWLNQAIKGARDRHGNEITNAHLLVLFNRICKLLYYRVKPVFVFDGPPPLLKMKTLESRRQKRHEAGKKAGSLVGKKALKLLEAHAIQSITGREIVLPSSLYDKAHDDDMFRLPSFPENTNEGSNNDENTLSNNDDDEIANVLHLDPQFQSFRNSLETVDVDSESFTALPLEMQHDLLIEKKENEKNSYVDPKMLPKEATGFSDYQLMKVIRRSHLSRKLQNVRKTLNLSQSASLGITEEQGLEVESSHIASSEERRYILIKRKDLGYLSQEDVAEDSDLIEGDTEQSDQVNVDVNIELSENKQVNKDLADSDSEVEFEEPSTLALNMTEPMLPEPEPVILSAPAPVLTSSYKPVSFESSPEIETLSTSVTEPVTEPVTISTSVIEPVTLSTSKALSPSESVTISTSEPVTISTSEQVTISTSEPVTISTSEPVTLSSEPVTISTSEPVITLPTSPLNEVLQPSSQDLVLNENDVMETLNEAKQLINLPSNEAEIVLRGEMDNLQKQTAQQQRRAAGITSIANKEAQELLRLFGLPYIESPSEAEAQCAVLESIELTQGTITDDNDVFLFGGRNVYRHVFSADRDLVMYTLKDIQSLLGLDRGKLIVLAYMLGSDYTDGLDGIGRVNAMEIVQFFSGDGDPLKKMRQWHIDSQLNPDLIQNAFHKKLRSISFPTNFPQENIREAYQNPLVDDSKEPFEWGKPDLDLIRQYTLTKFGWNQSDTDKILLPVLKKSNATSQQSTISKYFIPQPSTDLAVSYKSKRLSNAVARLTGERTFKGRSSSRGKRGRGKLHVGAGQRKRKAVNEIADKVTIPKRGKDTESSSSSSSDM